MVVMVHLMDEILVVEDLVKHYPVSRGLLPRTSGWVRAVDGVSFSIPSGSTLGLVGESGCGKTTVGRTIVRLTEPTSGRVLFDGRDVFSLGAEELRQLRRQMQIIFQDPYGSLNPRMTVGAMLAEPLLVHCEQEGGKREARRQVAELLALVGLSPEHASRYPHEFSGGQRQRIGIARALALKPRFVVCDEAVSALDVSIQAQILNLLKTLQEKFSLTYLFIAHDLAVVRHIAGRVAVMYLGRIVEEAPTEQIFTRPLHPYTQALLASVPIPAPHSKRLRIKLVGEAPTAIDPPAGCRFHTRCPIANEQCRQLEPPLAQVAPDHRVACIRTDESARFTPDLGGS
jgi:oligopeptide/dipeptide ABC transporter ATP-binding protein